MAKLDPVQWVGVVGGLLAVLEKVGRGVHWLFTWNKRRDSEISNIADKIGRDQREREARLLALEARYLSIFVPVVGIDQLRVEAVRAWEDGLTANRVRHLIERAHRELKGRYTEKQGQEKATQIWAELRDLEDKKPL